MNKEDLNELRTKIINSLDPLMLDESLSPESKFEYYLTISEITKQKESLEKAFDFAKEIKDNSLKANCLMNLLDLIAEIQSLEE